MYGFAVVAEFGLRRAARAGSTDSRFRSILKLESTTSGWSSPSMMIALSELSHSCASAEWFDARIASITWVAMWVVHRSKADVSASPSELRASGVVGSL